MERKIKFAIDEHYHIYSRGVEKRKIFLNKSDYKRFVSLLYIMNQPKSFHFQNFLQKHTISDIFKEERKDTLVDIISYVLMPNHFHILIYEKEEGGISKFMMKLLTAYSMYFNTKYKRSGPLFVHPFRSQFIADDPYYLWIFSYIHLNPIKLIQPDFKENGIKNIVECKKFLMSYEYSSYVDYLGYPRGISNIINFSIIPEYIKKNSLDLDFYTKNMEGYP